MQKKTEPTGDTEVTRSELWADYWRNPESGEAISRLMESLLPLIHRVLERVAITLPSHVSLEDLLQSATLGLYHAITRFDPVKGQSFPAFAYPRIRGAILDELRSMDHVSRSCRAQCREIEEAIRRWSQSHGAAPDEEAIAAELGLKRNELTSVLDRAQPWLSLDEGVMEGSRNNLTLLEVLADTRGLSPQEEAERQDLRRLVHKAFHRLDSREQKILYLYYYEDLRLSEIAELYELTEARICQIHALAIVKLRAALSEPHGKEAPCRKDSTGFR